jgi:hypothetical protein
LSEGSYQIEWYFFSGRMDAENAPQFEQQFRACIADWGGLTYVSKSCAAATPAVARKPRRVVVMKLLSPRDETSQALSAW